jgi:hypothetical protein
MSAPSAAQDAPQPAQGAAQRGGIFALIAKDGTVDRAKQLKDDAFKAELSKVTPDVTTFTFTNRAFKPFAPISY